MELTELEKENVQKIVDEAKKIEGLAKITRVELRDEKYKRLRIFYQLNDEYAKKQITPVVSRIREYLTPFSSEKYMDYPDSVCLCDIEY